MSLVALLAPLLVAAATPGVSPCIPIPGWDEVLASDRSRIIVFGEMHGSNEAPEIFADAVCQAAQSRKLVVGVEQPSSDQSAIDAFLVSDGGEAARRAFLAARMWNGAMKDGRSSEAIFALFERLRRMRAAKMIDAVIAFQPSNFTERPSPEQYEKAMAELIVAGAPRGATVLALVGNAHAMLTNVPWEPRYMPMAGHLPAEEVLTFNIVGEGGETWVCQASPDDCGPRALPDSPVQMPRGIEMSTDRTGAYSGILKLGRRMSASPPQQSSGAEG